LSGAARYSAALRDLNTVSISSNRFVVCYSVTVELPS